MLTNARQALLDAGYEQTSFGTWVSPFSGEVLSFEQASDEYSDTQYGDPLGEAEAWDIYGDAN